MKRLRHLAIAVLMVLAGCVVVARVQYAVDRMAPLPKQIPITTTPPTVALTVPPQYTTPPVTCPPGQNWIYQGTNPDDTISMTCGTLPSIPPNSRPVTGSQFSCQPIPCQKLPLPLG